MATQYDIPWREDIFDEWDFYDVSQSIGMQLTGYRIVVPYQETTWCYHDCGPSNLQNYDTGRKKAIKTYPLIFSGNNDEIGEQGRQAIFEQLVWIKEAFSKLISVGAYKELCDAERQLGEIQGIRDREVSEMMNFARIYALEVEKGIKHSTIFEWRDWQKMYSYYKWTRLVIMRIGWARKDERIEELKKDIQNGVWSGEAIFRIAQTCLDSGLENIIYFLQTD